MKKKMIAVLIATLMVMLVVVPAFATHVEPQFIPQVPGGEDAECAAAAAAFGFTYAHAFKIDSWGELLERDGEYTDGNQIITISNSNDMTFDWSSKYAISAVLVKGGTGIHAYVYDPAENSDEELIAPNNNGGQQAGVSHVTFCYSFSLDVSKTANTTFTRTWTWTIDKTSETTEIENPYWSPVDVEYTVTLGATSADSDWAVNGEITIVNPDPLYAATIDSIVDVVSAIAPSLDPDVDATVTCPDSYDGTVAAGGTLVCTYSASLTNADSRLNTATVTVDEDSKVNGGSGEADVLFSIDPSTTVDGCVTVTDDKYGLLDAELCADELPTSYTYALTITPPQTQGCGVTEDFDNLATFTTNNTGTTGSEGHTVEVTVTCSGGCTLTQGYWKTHSDRGPAPYDDAWENLGALEEDTVFFLSGMTYYQVLWTSPGGNAYYNLAHQYIAAKLNVLNGASAPADVAAAITWAEAFFSANAPSSTLTKQMRAQVLANATLLDQFNNGMKGTLHCGSAVVTPGGVVDHDAVWLESGGLLGMTFLPTITQ